MTSEGTMTSTRETDRFGNVSHAVAVDGRPLGRILKTGSGWQVEPCPFTSYAPVASVKAGMEWLALYARVVAKGVARFDANAAEEDEGNPCGVPEAHQEAPDTCRDCAKPIRYLATPGFFTAGGWVHANSGRAWAKMPDGTGHMACPELAAQKGA